MPDSDRDKHAGKSEEERLRRRAYELWEREGRPHGRHEHHWHLAREEAARGSRDGADAQAVPAARTGAGSADQGAPRPEGEETAARRLPPEERSSGTEADPLGLVQGESAGFGAGISDDMVENTTTPTPAKAEPQTAEPSRPAPSRPAGAKRARKREGTSPPPRRPGRPR